MSDVIENTEPAGEFNLEPDPRVLPMLGEINLDQSLETLTKHQGRRHDRSARLHY